MLLFVSLFDVLFHEHRDLELLLDPINEFGHVFALERNLNMGLFTRTNIVHLYY